MKKLKLIFVLLLSLALIFTLVACGGPCTEHVDANKDGKCDKCKTEVPCEEHTDENEDYVCDVCGEELEAPLAENTDMTLIEGGEVLFRIVSGSDLNSDSMKLISKFVSGLKKLDLEVESVEHTSEPDDSIIEVLVGTVTTRGDAYYVDPHTLGEEGYLIKSIGNKIIVIGGSPEETADALETFIEKMIGYTSKTKELDDVTILAKQWKEKPQTNFKISSISVGGEDIKGYNIATNLDIKAYERAAMELQSTLYSRAGLWLDIVPLNEASEKSIVIKKVGIGEAGEKGFRGFVDGTQLVFECAHDNKLEEAIDKFLSELLYAKDELKFGSNYSFEHMISILYYDDFGAKGDGKTNDYAAIKATHDEANKGGQTVMATAGKTYRIASIENEGGVAYSILIKTNTNWNGAKIVFDDTDIVVGTEERGKDYNTPVFEVAPDTPIYTLSEEELATVNAHIAANGGTLKAGAKNIGLTFDCDVMLTIYYHDNRVYVRYGGDANDGSPQHEVILVDKDGNIDPSTPILFEYSKLTNVKVHRLDGASIVLENGTVESLGSHVNVYTPGPNGSPEAYLARYIAVKRAHTVVRNIKHVITGEIPMGTPVYAGTGNIAEGYHYTGEDKGLGKIIHTASNKEVTDGSIVPFMGYGHGAFIDVGETSHVLIESCVFQARMYYNTGTYDISIGRANDVTFKDCTQSNFWYEKSTGKFYSKTSDTVGKKVSINVSGNPCWGIMGSSSSKNIVYDHCSLVRFDAHEGLVNGKIINGSEVGMLRITGGGELLIADSTVHCESSSSPLSLREDYGSTFKGTLILRNLDIVSAVGSKPPAAIVRIMSANHNFGYTCHFCNLVVDDVRFIDRNGDNILTEIAIVLDYQCDPNATFNYRGVSDPNIHIAGEVCVDGRVNINPYQPPEFLEVKNNSQNGYTVYLKNYPFWANTEIKGDIEVR